MSDILVNKAELIELGKKKAAEFGLTTADFDVMKTSGYFNSMLVEGFDAAVHTAAMIQKERYASTADLKDSLIKIGKDANVELDFAKPSKALVNMSLYIDEIMELATEIEPGVYQYILNKDEYGIDINNIPFCFDYDIVIKIVKNTSLTKNIDPYFYRVSYSAEDKDHPLDVDSLNGKPINSFVIPSTSEIGKSLLSMIVLVRQYVKKYNEFRYYKGDGSTEIQTFEFSDNLAEFKLYYQDKDYADKREIEKSLYFNKNLDVNSETLFYKYKSSTTISLINKRTANFTPVINSLLTVESYITLGENGSFSYTGSNINITTTGDTPLSAIISILSQPAGGANMPTIEELRNKIILFNSSRGNIINEKDLKRLYATSNSGVYKIRKSRHDSYENEYVVTTALKDDVEDIYINTSTLDLYVDLSAIPAIKDVNTKKDRFYNICGDYIYSYGYGEAYLSSQVVDGVTSYEYLTPFTLSYDSITDCIDIYERNVDRKYYMKPAYTKPESDYHFIINALRLRQSLGQSYNITFNAITSLPADNDIVFHERGEYLEILDKEILRMRMVFKRNGLVLGYLVPVMIAYDEVEKFYVYGIDEFVTSLPYGDRVNLELHDMLGVKTTVQTPLDNIDVDIYVYMKNEGVANDNIFPDNAGFEQIDAYSVSGVELIRNLTYIAKMNIQHLSNTRKKIYSVPMIDSYMYENMPDKVTEAINNEISKLDAIYLLTEQNFSQRIVFANTYGFAARYKVGTDLSVELNNLALSLVFNIKFKDGYTTTTADISSLIKTYMDSIDFNNGDSFRVSELIAILHTAFSDILVIEFDGMNNLPSPYQYIALDPSVIGNISDKTVPEIIHLKHIYSELLDAWIPDITINIIEN